jgi:hypothetical protein
LQHLERQDGSSQSPGSLMGPMLAPPGTLVLESVEGDRQLPKQPLVDKGRQVHNQHQVEQNPDGSLLIPPVTISDMVSPSSSSMALVPFTEASQNSKTGKRNLHTRR